MYRARSSSLLGKITVLLVICCCCLPAQGKYGGGTGEPNDPYLIYDANQMNAIGVDSNDWDKCFKLMADIDLGGYTGTSYNIIGYWVDWDDYNPFTGVFDGNGHTISNFSYTSTDIDYIGLFGYVDDPNAEINNLGLIAPDVDSARGNHVGSLVGYNSYGTIRDCYAENVSVSGGWNVSGLVGYNYHGTVTKCYAEGGSVSGSGAVGALVGLNRGTINNCYSEADVSGMEDVGTLVGRNYSTITNCYSAGSVVGDDHVGGLVGNNQFGTTIDCTATGSVSGNKYVGGLVGGNWHGTITNCYLEGSVTGDEYVGGLAGVNTYYGTITNCYSEGDVSGNRYVGGLLGSNGWCHSWGGCYPGTVSNCYSTGSVEGLSDIGGLVGYNEDGDITNSFWDIETSGQVTSAGGTGKTTAEMQMQVTFTDAGWDFVGETVNGIEDIWFIPKQDYPHLWWEGMQVPMKLTPRTLNCRSQGNWVKAHISLPVGFSIADINSERPAVLHSFGIESAPLYVFINENGLVEIEAAFEREAVCSLAGDWPQALTVAGFLTDGNIFLGTSKVKINHPGLNVIEELANYWLQGDCVHPTWCDGIDMNRDSLVNLLDYALIMNIKVEFVTDE